MGYNNNNNNTHRATIALLPSITHPQSWAEPHIHAHTGKSLPFVPPSPEEQNLPSTCLSTPANCRSSAQGLKLTRARVITVQFCLHASQTPTTYFFSKLGKSSKSYSQNSLPNTYAVFSVLLSSAYPFPKSSRSFSTKVPLIIESVDSICRDGADTPISLNKSNSSELPNADVLSLFRQTT